MAAERERLLGKLPFAASASFDSYPRQHETGCLEGTRVDLLQQLERWSVAHERPIFWLSGMAGTGKSTIARTLATRLKSQGLLCGNFFFSRASGEVSNGFLNYNNLRLFESGVAVCDSSHISSILHREFGQEVRMAC